MKHMKFHISHWLTLVTLLAASGSAWAQTRHYKIDSEETVNAFYEGVLNLPDRIAKAKSIMLDNELEPNEEGRDANFYNNPLVLDGKPLEYADFSLRSKGALAVVKGNPESPDATAIPFQVYLRRNGTIVCLGKSDPKREVTAVEISEVLKHAKNGDHLIIAPARKSDWKAKRIILVFDGC